MRTGIEEESPYFATPWLQPTRLLCPWDFPGKGTGVGRHFLLQGIFPTQGSNPGLLHCRQILYWLSYKRSPYLLAHVLEWLCHAFQKTILIPPDLVWSHFMCYNSPCRFLWVQRGSEYLQLLVSWRIFPKLWGTDYEPIAFPSPGAEGILSEVPNK